MSGLTGSTKIFTSNKEDVAQCKRYLEENPTMTMVQLAEVLGTSTEQLDITQELANIAVKDIFEHLQVLKGSSKLRFSKSIFRTIKTTRRVYQSWFQPFYRRFKECPKIDRLLYIRVFHKPV